MLTIQSNLKIQDLETLAKILIKPDIINFGLNKVGGGYTGKIADKIIAKLSKLDKNKIIVIINDITLQMADKLLEAGYKNIYLAFGRFNKDGSVSKDKTVYNIMKAIIKNNIKQKLSVISLEEIFNMKIDGIIANVPYGAIGANIAYTIRDKIDYEYFVNLLPANDYKRNKTKDLFNYQSEMEAINDGFDDAVVTTHCALIHKNKINNMSLDKFEMSQYIDSTLNKYFLENSKRINNFIISYKPNLDSFRDTIDITKSFYINKRDVAHKHLAYSKNCNAYRWNVLENITKDEVLQNNAKSEQALGRVGDFVLVLFNSYLEKTNLSKFIYSDLGFRFISKVFTALNKDSYYSPENYLPKVDWTREWTVEEILADYGYTEAEIKEVIDDLANFKGMDD